LAPHEILGFRIGEEDPAIPVKRKTAKPAAATAVASESVVVALRASRDVRG